MQKFFIFTLLSWLALGIMALLIYRYWYEGMPADQVMQYLPYLIIMYFVTGCIASMMMLFGARRR